MNKKCAYPDCRWFNDIIVLDKKVMLSMCGQCGHLNRISINYEPVVEDKNSSTKLG